MNIEPEGEKEVRFKIFATSKQVVNVVLKGDDGKVYYSRQVTITPEELLNETVDVAGEKLNKLNLEITANGKELLYWHAEPDFSQVTEDETEVFSEAAATILAEGDAIGMVLLLSRDTERIFGEFEQKMAICGANFLGRQMEP